jgi:hypothetical protein
VIPAATLLQKSCSPRGSKAMPVFKTLFCHAGRRVPNAAGQYLPHLTNITLGAPLANSKTAVSVADVLEREVESTIKYWLQRVNLIPALANVPISDADRIGYMPQLHMGLVWCLRFARDGRVPLSVVADKHGTVRNSLIPSAARPSGRRGERHSCRYALRVPQPRRPRQGRWGLCAS